MISTLATIMTIIFLAFRITSAKHFDFNYHDCSLLNWSARPGSNREPPSYEDGVRPNTSTYQDRWELGDQWFAPEILPLPNRLHGGIVF